uniref:Cupin type-1 domain-containing protein n=1 Tax=Catharus ustulatus TaxID=91951 RepID=A0A8C3UDJ2_CATUS
MPKKGGKNRIFCGIYEPMENLGFELQEEKSQRNKKEFQNVPKKFPGGSLLRFFLLCLLASLLSTALGVLLLALLGNKSGEWKGESTTETTNSGQGEGKFKFVHRLENAKVFKYPGGEIQWARFRRDRREYENSEAEEFGRSLNFYGSQITVGTLRIWSQGLRAPHWHFNANEHGYVVKGEAWIGVLGPDGAAAVTFNATRGAVVFFPRGAVHWVRNVGPSELLLLLFFSTHHELLTLDLDDAFYGTPEDVAARALKPQGGVKFIRTFQKPREDQAINLPKNLGQLIHNPSYPQSPDAQVWKFFMIYQHPRNSHSQEEFLSGQGSGKMGQD